jgi:catechol 2,3-dioxygenase-like lactoylglutathione lyase family enzyme
VRCQVAATRVCHNRHHVEEVVGDFPHLLHTAIDCLDARALAEFYRELLGLQYRDGDEPPADESQDDADWLVLVDSHGQRKLAFQRVERLERTTWPSPEVPMQMHLDLTVATIDDLEKQRERAESLGAQLLLDRTDDADEPLYVFADLAGHPFCIFVR